MAATRDKPGHRIHGLVPGTCSGPPSMACAAISTAGRGWLACAGHRGEATATGVSPQAPAWRRLLPPVGYVDAPDHDDEGQARATPPFSRHASPIGMAINPAATGAPMWNIRPGRDSDGPRIIALIGSCWSRYPGVHMNVDREMPELHALATYYYRQRDGALWVTEDGGRIIGMIATRPLDAGAWEICRVYVAPALHGSGLGHALLDRAEHHAVTAGAERLALWS